MGERHHRRVRLSSSKMSTNLLPSFLLWSLPKFEQLTPPEKLLYHNSKSIYTSSTSSNRDRGRGLLYAQSGLDGETWVPLAEKAYAKMRGDYASLEGGFVHEGIEDLTGGTSVVYLTLVRFLLFR